MHTAKDSGEAVIAAEAAAAEAPSSTCMAAVEGSAAGERAAANEEVVVWEDVAEGAEATSAGAKESWSS